MNPVALIIDDEVQIRRLLRVGLEGAGYKVCEAPNGQEGLQEIVYKKPDVVLLDLGLPDMDGVTVLKRLREWSQVPVVVLTVREDDQDKVAALDAGADDYVTKPFSTSELLARLRAVQRRAPEAQTEPMFVCGDLIVDLAARTVTVKGQTVHLTATEYALLHELVRHAGKVVVHKQLLRAVWGPKAEEQSQYLRVYITHLRKKLESDSHKKLIQTESGIGYRLVMES
jgi:two-component system, OmpR family, KDP operon response regulator KdpE